MDLPEVFIAFPVLSKASRRFHDQPQTKIQNLGPGLAESTENRERERDKEIERKGEREEETIYSMNPFKRRKFSLQ